MILLTDLLNRLISISISKLLVLEINVCGLVTLCCHIVSSTDDQEVAEYNEQPVKNNGRQTNSGTTGGFNRTINVES